MPGKDSSRDWFARGVAALGIILSIFGLSLTYYNYRWQRAAYQENLAERILVRLSISRTVKRTGPFSLDPKGECGVEVVNIGVRPLYIKRVTVEIRSRIFTFYEHEPANPNKPMKPLEPSEAANYRLSWDFSEHPLMKWPESDREEEHIWVRVETTKKSFVQHQFTNSVSLSSSVSQKSDAAPKPHD